MNLILLGPPGCGKGTQALNLVNKFDYYHLSTGDILREAIANETQTGKLVKDVLASGKLVEDELIIKIMEEKIVETISSNIHLFAIDSDLFFTAEEDQKTLKRLKKLKKNIFYHEIKSIHGHDAFLIENETVSQILSSILNSKSNYSKLYEGQS